VPVWYEAPLEMNEGTPSGQEYNRLYTGPIERPLNLFLIALRAYVHSYDSCDKDGFVSHLHSVIKMVCVLSDIGI
jgi:hypothetical protein